MFVSSANKVGKSARPSHDIYAAKNKYGRDVVQKHQLQQQVG
jgi:hypothetical protein